MLEKALRLGVSHTFCLKNSIFLRIRYCYYIASVGSPGSPGLLYYMIFFCWASGVVRSGSARTLYLNNDLWSCLLELVKLGYAENVSQLVNRLLADALGKLDSASKSEDLDYEILKKRHLNLSRELVRLEKHMKDYGGDYQALVGLF